MSEDTNVPENSASHQDGDDDGDFAAPESKNWWQFDSKDDAVEWINDKVQKRLGREKNKFNDVLAERDTLKAEVEELRPLKQATQTDAERWEAEKANLAKELEELRSFKSQAERTNLIREIAEDKGLPARFVNRVQGSTPEEITADIEDLLNVLEDGKPKKPAPQKPKPADEKAPTRGHGGGGSDDDSDSATTSRIIKKYRESRNTFSL